jgi:hydrogenase expression/formation protein HypC
LLDLDQPDIRVSEPVINISVILGTVADPSRAEQGMCLGIPMEVIAVDGHLARCSVKGIEREVSLFLMQDQPVQTGDFVMVHVGYAIQKMTPQQARSAWELYDEVLAAEGEEGHA